MTARPAPDRSAGPSDVFVRATGSFVVRLVGLGAALAALIVLAAGAVHGLHSSANRAAGSAVVQARLDDAYYACLGAQAESLVGPARTVDVSTADVGAWATLAKVMAPRDQLTTHRSRAVALLSLATHPGPTSCLGSVVVAVYPNGTTRTGTGASLPGTGSPSPPSL